MPEADLPPFLPEETSAPQSSFESDPDSDIRNLTRETVEMSGLDDLDWKIEETHSPAFPPPPPQEEVKLELDPPSFTSRDEVLPSLSPDPLTQAEMGELIERKVLEMARELLPEIAERILSQEIKKMLQE
jgi:hypothetical protein